MGGKPPGEFLGTPSKSVIYHPRSMSGKFGTIGRHVTISRLRALTISRCFCGKGVPGGFEGGAPTSHD